jgi:hypothetical protein
MEAYIVYYQQQKKNTFKKQKILFASSRKLGCVFEQVLIYPRTYYRFKPKA